MPTRGRSRGASSGGTSGPRSRPRYTWRMFKLATTNLAVGATTAVNMESSGSWPGLSSGLGIFGDYTIRRIVGSLAVTSDSVAEAESPMLLLYGVYIGEDDAIVAGAFPELDADPADWMMFGTVYLNSIGAFSAGVHPVVERQFDNRSMRKVNENHQSPMFLITNPATTTEAVKVSVAGRFLVSHGQR